MGIALTSYYIYFTTSKIQYHYMETVRSTQVRAKLLITFSLLLILFLPFFALFTFFSFRAYLLHFHPSEPSTDTRLNPNSSPNHYTHCKVLSSNHCINNFLFFTLSVQICINFVKILFEYSILLLLSF